MKALLFDVYGPPTVLRVADVPLPKPAAGDVLVQIEAAAINPSDVKIVGGAFQHPLPRIPGRDFAGVVVGGEGETGTRVWGSGVGFGLTRDGAHAEFAVLPAAWISRRPSTLAPEQAATVGVPYVTAWSTLVRAGGIQAGETVLIVGVSGAVGRAATQIAHWRKARVIGAASRSENPSGADVVVNTTTQDLAQEVRALTGGKGADLVLDMVGGPLFEAGLKSLRVGGRQIAISSPKERRVSFDLTDFYHNATHLMGVDTLKLTGPEVADLLNELRPGFEEGHLQIPAPREWPLDEAVAAYETVAQGGSPLKHVLLMGGKGAENL
jgi:NADPH:quinone reductase-like Zn-dependent oxidoreductase